MKNESICLYNIMLLFVAKIMGLNVRAVNKTCWHLYPHSQQQSSRACVKLIYYFIWRRKWTPALWATTARVTDSHRSWKAKNMGQSTSKNLTCLTRIPWVMQTLFVKLGNTFIQVALSRVWTWAKGWMRYKPCVVRYRLIYRKRSLWCTSGIIVW